MRIRGHQHRQQPRIFWSPSDNMWAVQTPYSESFVQRLKTLPRANRRFDGQSKCWLVSDSHLDRARQLVQEEFGPYDFIPKVEPPAGNGQIDGGAYKTFLVLIGFDDAFSMYKQAIKRYHPDLGGDTKKAQELNVAWNNIRDTLKGDS